MKCYAKIHKLTVFETYVLKSIDQPTNNFITSQNEIPKKKAFMSNKEKGNPFKH